MLEKRLKFISFIVGLTIIIASLLYILYTDLALANSAQWLFISILAAFGSGFCWIFSSKMKHRHSWFYTLEGLAIFFAIVFMIVVGLYAKNIDYNSANETIAKNAQRIMTLKGIKSTQLMAKVSFIKTISFVLASIGIAGQVTNVVSNIIYKIDD